jgi:SAM-dependent methyltransferase
MSDSAGPNDESQARRAYDAFAPIYDAFLHGYMYERWTGRLLGKAEDAGLSGKRLLDVGCGTGLSFTALLDRGFQVTGCDISPGMIEEARKKFSDTATLLVADMRELPALGEFDLVWSVNDAVNYLLSPEELQAALGGMRANLAPDGVLLFDVNTLQVYRTFFSEERVIESEGKKFTWRGQASAEGVSPAGFYEARLEGEGEVVEAHVHRQRHFPEAEALAAIGAAGLRCVEVAGELEGDLETGLDEDRHTKAVYVCRAG